MTFEIPEDQRQLIILALALMSIGPRPGFDFAAGNAAETLGGRKMFEQFKLLNQQEQQ